MAIPKALISLASFCVSRFCIIVLALKASNACSVKLDVSISPEKFSSNTLQIDPEKSFNIH